MNPTVYLETSVVSYLTGRPSQDVVTAAYQEITQEWWSRAPDRFSLVTSKLVVTEAVSGDSDAARARLAALETIPLVEVTVEAIELDRELVDRGAVPPGAADDAAHIATAAAHGLDYLVTWNFRHIANATMRPRIEDVCRSSGYEPPVICTPRELMETAHSGSTGMAMQGTRTDPIIGELHSIRDQHAARFGYDIDAILQDIRTRQETSGREYFRLPAREVT
ncbi:MAG: type II toxin-antitoxin system VapC family toxin [Acidobacteriia bacterium]|nr:type II toxin-antitoxin system VapC family toxin [Terriglobia bacterium]